MSSVYKDQGVLAEAVLGVWSGSTLCGLSAAAGALAEKLNLPRARTSPPTAGRTELPTAPATAGGRWCLGCPWPAWGVALTPFSSLQLNITFQKRSVDSGKNRILHRFPPK